MSKTNVALIGLGAIGQYVAAARRADEPWQISHVILRPDRAAAYRSVLPKGAQVAAGTTGLDAPKPGLAVECAGQPAVREHVPALLAAGIDTVVCSVGALAEPDLLAVLQDAAAESGAKILLPAGALGAIDALAAARQGGLSAVQYSGIKPPQAWDGSPAGEIIDLRKIDRETVFFEGTAREAALRFPKNANVAATVALAGVGLDETAVTLIADPAATGNLHRVVAFGAFGEFAFEIEGAPLPDKPGSSSLTPMSLLRAIRNRAGMIEI